MPDEIPQGEDKQGSDFGVARASSPVPLPEIPSQLPEGLQASPDAPAQSIPATREDASVVPDIAARLGQNDANATVDESQVARPASPLPFDLSALRPEQLQQLKAMLEATPLRSQKKGNPLVSLRKFVLEGTDEERIIIDFKNAKSVFVRDEVAQVTSETLMIGVRFLGDPEGKFTNVLYKDFINSTQFQVEVISNRRVKGGYDEGEVFSKDKGTIVPMRVETVQDFFTVKLPEGTTPATIELESRIVNA